MPTISWYVLVLFFTGAPSTIDTGFYIGGVSIGYYRSFETCDVAGQLATKRFTVDHICLPVDRPLGRQ